jgi:hypothetical protein
MTSSHENLRSLPDLAYIFTLRKKECSTIQRVEKERIVQRKRIYRVIGTNIIHTFHDAICTLSALEIVMFYHSMCK